jgi:hypothetical protein
MPMNLDASLRKIGCNEISVFSDGCPKMGKRPHWFYIVDDYVSDGAFGGREARERVRVLRRVVP